MGWILREKGADLALCETLDRRAADIYTACFFQDITGQRTEKVVKVLPFIEERLNAMIEIWSVEEIGFRLGDWRQGRCGPVGCFYGPQAQAPGSGKTLSMKCWVSLSARPH